MKLKPKPSAIQERLPPDPTSTSPTRKRVNWFFPPILTHSRSRFGLAPYAERGFRLLLFGLADTEKQACASTIAGGENCGGHHHEVDDLNRPDSGSFGDVEPELPPVGALPTMANEHPGSHYPRRSNFADECGAPPGGNGRVPGPIAG